MSVLLCSLLGANCLFQSRIQRLYQNIVQCIRFENVHWCEKGCFEKKADVCVSGFRLLNLIFEDSQKILLFDEFTSSAVVSTYCSVAEICLFWTWNYLWASCHRCFYCNNFFGVEVIHRWLKPSVRTLIICIWTADIVKQYVRGC